MNYEYRVVGININPVQKSDPAKASQKLNFSKEFLEKQAQQQSSFTGMFKNLFGYNQEKIKYPRGSYLRYLEKHKLSDEMRECPICLTDFDHYDQVIGLKCSNLHIYHKECIKDMVH